MSNISEKIQILKQKQLDALESNYLGGPVVVGRAWKNRMILYEKLSIINNNIEARKMGEAIEDKITLRQNSYEYVDLRKGEVCLIDGEPFIFLNAFYDEENLLFYVRNKGTKEIKQIKDYRYNRSPRRKYWKSKKYIWLTKERK
tara:strand:+ start:490 stop:921 length:432 start_codon:yes stop_codon:yes gene_type:complete